MSAKVDMAYKGIAFLYVELLSGVRILNIKISPFSIAQFSIMRNVVNQFKTLIYHIHVFFSGGSVSKISRFRG